MVSGGDDVKILLPPSFLRVDSVNVIVLLFLAKVFGSARNFNADVSNWDVGKVTAMESSK